MKIKELSKIKEWMKENYEKSGADKKRTLSE